MIAILRSERFVLRPFCLADATAVFEYACDPRFSAFLPIPHPYTVVHAEQFVAAQVALNHEVHASWAIDVAGRAVGGLNIRFLADHRLAEIGYAIAPALWNRGITTEAARMVLTAAFATYPQLARVQATADSRNTASIRVMEKLGLRREGLLRRQRICRNELTDQIICGVLREEWLACIDVEADL
jgi:ribosomal-protein-alanine N-acetyltransferase